MNYYYGGAFNPMTKAHLKLIQDLLADMDEDDVLIIGITDYGYKKYAYSYEQRLKILQANINKLNTDHVVIVRENTNSWKFLTTHPIAKAFRPLTLVMGKDSYSDLIKMNVWENSIELLENFNFKVIHRENNEKEVSSTKARELLAQKASYEDLNKYITKTTWDMLMENADK